MSKINRNIQVRLILLYEKDYKMNRLNFYFKSNRLSLVKSIKIFQIFYMKVKNLHS